MAAGLKLAARDWRLMVATKFTRPRQRVYSHSDAQASFRQRHGGHAR